MDRKHCSPARNIDRSVKNFPGKAQHPPSIKFCPATSDFHSCPSKSQTALHLPYGTVLYKRNRLAVYCNTFRNMYGRMVAVGLLESEGAVAQKWSFNSLINISGSCELKTNPSRRFLTGPSQRSSLRLSFRQPGPCCKDCALKKEILY